MSQFRKKPVVIDAWKIDHDATQPEWVKVEFRAEALDWCPSDEGLWISTLEGSMTGSIGDMLIRGVKGEFYACKPDIFALTYEDAASPPPQGEPQTDMPVVAWEHVMDNTEGIPENDPSVCLSHYEENPFGTPGIDYSKTFPVTFEPLVYLVDAKAAIDTLTRERDEARAALPKLSEPAVLHAVTQAQADSHKQGDVAFWMAFTERLRVQWNCMVLPAALHPPQQARAILDAHPWCVAGWLNAIKERDEARENLSRSNGLLDIALKHNAIKARSDARRAAIEDQSKALILAREALAPLSAAYRLNPYGILGVYGEKAFKALGAIDAAYAAPTPTGLAGGEA